MAGSHVDLLSFVANDAGGGGRARVGAAGGEGGWPFALAPGEYLTRISGRTGCGYLACWMLFETSTGATKSIGTYDGLAEGGAVFELSPPPGRGVVGIARDASSLDLPEPFCAFGHYPLYMSYAAAAAASHMGNGAFLEVLDEAPHAPVYHPPPTTDGARGLPVRRPRQGQPVARGDAADAADANLRAAAAVAARAAVAAVAAAARRRQPPGMGGLGALRCGLRLAARFLRARRRLPPFLPPHVLRTMRGDSDGRPPRAAPTSAGTRRASPRPPPRRPRLGDGAAYATTADSYFASFAILDADGTPLMERTFGGGQYDMLPITIEDGPVTLTAEFTADDMREAAVNISAGYNSDPLAARYVK